MFAKIQQYRFLFARKRDITRARECSVLFDSIHCVDDSPHVCSAGRLDSFPLGLETVNPTIFFHSQSAASQSPWRVSDNVIRFHALQRLQAVVPAGSWLQRPSGDCATSRLDHGFKLPSEGAALAADLTMVSTSLPERLRQRPTGKRLGDWLAKKSKSWKLKIEAFRTLKGKLKNWKIENWRKNWRIEKLKDWKIEALKKWKIETRQTRPSNNGPPRPPLPIKKICRELQNIIPKSVGK